MQDEFDYDLSPGQWDPRERGANTITAQTPVLDAEFTGANADAKYAPVSRAVTGRMGLKNFGLTAGRIQRISSPNRLSGN